jgi:hypothetical protein
VLESCTLGTAGRWLRPNNLDTTDSTSSKITGAGHPVQGKAPLLLAIGEGLSIQKEPLESWTVDQDARLPGSHVRQGPTYESMMIGIVCSNRKDPDLWTPTPFMSGLKVFSPFIRVNNT